MKTKAICFPEPNKYEVIELTLDNMGPEDIRVRTLVTAISPGTERWILRGKHIGSRFPNVPGYHRIGIVEECGKKVTDFEPGDIVYGAGNRWKEKKILAMWGAHIGHSVSACAGYNFIAPTRPNPFELDNLSLTIVVAVAQRGIRFLEVQPQQRVLIIGAGIIGLCAAQLAGLRAAQAVLLEKDPDRVALAGRMGLAAVSSEDKEIDKKLSELAPEGYDALYDTVGHPPTIDASVKRMKHGSKLLLQAQYFDKERCAIDLDQIKIREMTVKTTCGTYPQDFMDTVRDIRTRRLKIAPLITHRLRAPDELVKGYTVLDQGKPFNLGIVFRWS